LKVETILQGDRPEWRGIAHGTGERGTINIVMQHKGLARVFLHDRGNSYWCANAAKSAYLNANAICIV
jgi:hypothetical protein